MLRTNERASTRIFPQGTIMIGADEVSVTQTEQSNMVIQMADGSEREIYGG